MTYATCHLRGSINNNSGNNIEIVGQVNALRGYHQKS